jgi:YD repeat-containing protein
VRGARVTAPYVFRASTLRIHRFYRTEYYADSLGGWTKITDPAGKIRKQLKDGLGRLAGVIEDSNGLNYSTSYEYDALDNLTHVNQSGRERSFSYSSLGGNL